MLAGKETADATVYESNLVFLGIALAFPLVAVLAMIRGGGSWEDGDVEV